MGKNKIIKNEPLEKPDVEFKGSARIQKMDVKKSGKVEVSTYCNIEHYEFHESARKNMPNEIKDGETYYNAEIKSTREASIKENNKNNKEENRN